MTETARPGLVAAMVAAGTTRSMAEHIDTYELARFPEEDVKAILAQVQPFENLRGSYEPCGPRFCQRVELSLREKIAFHGFKYATVAAMVPAQLAGAAVLAKRGNYQAIRKEIPVATTKAMDFIDADLTFVKPEEDLIRQSIATSHALCVNRAGKFRLMASGYVVCSHAWAETMSWSCETSHGPVELSVRKAGMPLSHLQRVIDRCEADWLWLDVIAMPEVLEDMNEDEKNKTEGLRTEIINTLHQVYINADSVAVLDSLSLRLISGSPLDAAVSLCMGYWRTRLWTFTECRLAKRVLIKTADTSFDLDDIIEFLKSDIDNEDHRYSRLLELLIPFRPVPEGSFRFIFYTSEQQRLQEVPLIYDICFGSTWRNTMVEADHVRALFPLLQLQWQHGWSVLDGFRHWLKQYPNDYSLIRAYLQSRQFRLPLVSWDDIVAE